MKNVPSNTAKLRVAIRVTPPKPKAIYVLILSVGGYVQTHVGTDPAYVKGMAAIIQAASAAMPSLKEFKVETMEIPLHG